jgi:hypothetical protein
MSEVAQRDFSNFELGDNVYELADGLIPEIAVHLDMKLGEEPNSEDMFKLVGKLGKNKVLRDNEEVTAINLKTAVNLLARSRVQKPLNRSLWTPEIGPFDDEDSLTIITGAIANWQDRAARLVKTGVETGMLSGKVKIVTGNRVMDRPTEKTNTNVQMFFDEEGRYPSETQYASDFVLPEIGARIGNGGATLVAYHTAKGDELAANFARDNKEMFDGVTPMPITFARVANAGVQLAVQFRSAIREHADPSFDEDHGSPEAFVLTDSFPIARTEEEIADPANFQSPYSGLRQAVLTAKVLHEAATS